MFVSLLLFGVEHSAIKTFYTPKEAGEDTISDPKMENLLAYSWMNV